MQRKKILIVEDDETLGPSLKKSIEDMGRETVLVRSSSEALDLPDRDSVSLMIVDCLLPGEDGLELISKWKKKNPTVDVVLMSGILTDSNFVKEAVKTSGSKVFLKKPFDIQELLRFIPPLEDSSSLNLDPVQSIPSLYEIYEKDKLTDREKKKFVEGLEDVHGFDLPLIYTLLVKWKISGHLNIVKQTGEGVSGVSFSRGHIVNVDFVDEDTYLGTLLIEQGYLQRDDLNIVLNIKSQKRIGEKLIHENLLSPHAFDLVLVHQMNLRLSKTIKNELVRVNFVETEVELVSPYIDQEVFDEFLHDWVVGLITEDWLRAHFLPWWNNYIVVRGDTKFPILSALPLFSQIPQLLEQLLQGKKKLSEILENGENKKLKEEVIYKALLFLVIKNLIYFEKNQKADEASQIQTLRKILRQFEGKTPEEVFELMCQVSGLPETKPQDVYSKFVSLAKLDLGPAHSEPLSGDQTNEASKTSEMREISEDLKRLQNQVNQAAQRALEYVLSGERERAKTQRVQQDLEQKLAAVTVFEEAQKLLNKGLYFQAKGLLEKAHRLDPTLEKLRLHQIWAKMGLGASVPVSNPTFLNDIELELTQVSPEEKHEALYHFLMGQLMRLKGKDPGQARRFVEKALSIDGTLVAARKELTLINNSLVGGKKDPFNTDLKDLVGSLFKKTS